MTAFAQHAAFTLRTGLRNKDLLLMNYMLPLGFFLMMGTIMTEEINPFFLDTMIPAMMIFAALSGAILGLPNPLVEDREAGILRSYKINGVPAASILAVPALATVIHMLVVGTVIAGSAQLIFAAPLPVNWLMLAVTYLAFLFTCSGLGLLIGTISKNTQATIMWSQLVFLPSIMLGGLMMPASILPEALQQAARLLPSTYAMDAFRALAMGYEAASYAPVLNLVILVAGGILAYALAWFLFSWDSHNTERRGRPILALLAILPYLAGALFLP